MALLHRYWRLRGRAKGQLLTLALETMQCDTGIVHKFESERCAKEFAKGVAAVQQIHLNAGTKHRT